MLSPEQATDIAARLVERAVKAGATAADAMLVAGSSTSVSVRLGELEDVSRSDDREIGLRVFAGQRSASVASANFSDDSLDELVARAVAMAAEAPEDPFAGLAAAELLLTGAAPDLEAYDASDPDPAALRARALAAEVAARAMPGVTNSNGGSAGSSASTVALATSGGFAGAYRASGFSCSASVVAGEGSAMQRDYASHVARFLEDLEAAEEIGRRAGERAAARVGPVKPAPGRYPVLFDPRVAASLLGHFSAATSGSAVARKTSFLLERLGERVFAPGVTIRDDPHRPRGLRSRPFDGEGLPTRALDLVADGVLTSWVADSAAARQLGIAPTGHASRGVSGAPGAAPSNLSLLPGTRSREELLAAFPRAILVTELIGQGVNGVTGDYSRGAAGFLIEGGEIVGPVAEITVASNLKDMFATLEPGSDLEYRRGVDAPTLLIPEMTVAAG
ncbi:metallopeptidase TldD-related protein [Sphingomonas sp. BN140010]|uniref:Metallopeptidase TldD-related protein n=1 Tax=Sphingomonas arvum TaxID=2992113 RepID=A0ABT3JCG0_9SPHN|nr:metallopeptidase TldD-related protein [Sphingomonas sp. BN140010]MCW3796450.1 metallopeptidase TldD-related protein [Sphingomonas sp. BN140010]